MRTAVKVLSIFAIVLFSITFAINLSMGIIIVVRPDMVREETILELANRYNVSAGNMEDLTLICGLITLLLGAFSIFPLGFAIVSLVISKKCQKRVVFIVFGILELFAFSLPIGILLILIGLFECKN